MLRSGSAKLIGAATGAAENSNEDESTTEGGGAELGRPKAGEGAGNEKRGGDEETTVDRELGWRLTADKLGKTKAGEDAAEEEREKLADEETANKEGLDWALTDAPKLLEPNATTELKLRPALLEELEKAFTLDSREVEGGGQTERGRGAKEPNKDELPPIGTKSGVETKPENTFEADEDGAVGKGTAELDGSGDNRIANGLVPEDDADDIEGTGEVGDDANEKGGEEPPNEPKGMLPKGLL